MSSVWVEEGPLAIVDKCALVICAERDAARCETQDICTRLEGELVASWNLDDLNRIDLVRITHRLSIRFDQ